MPANRDCPTLLTPAVDDQARCGSTMKRLISGIAALLLALAVLAASGAFAGASADPDGARRSPATAHGFERFLQRYEAANTAFVNGDPSPWLSITAEKDPASIFGGFGGLRSRHRERPPALPARGGRVPPERRPGRLRVPGQGRARQAGLHGGDRARQRPVRGADRATAADPAGHDDLPLREGRLEVSTGTRTRWRSARPTPARCSSETAMTAPRSWYPGRSRSTPGAPRR